MRYCLHQRIYSTSPRGCFFMSFKRNTLINYNSNQTSDVTNNRSSHRQLFCRRAVLQSFPAFTEPPTLLCKYNILKSYHFSSVNTPKHFKRAFLQYFSRWLPLKFGEISFVIIMSSRSALIFKNIIKRCSIR